MAQGKIESGRLRRECPSVKTSTELVLKLRSLKRGYKILFVLIAAWAPIVFISTPLLAALVGLVATVLFFLSTPMRRPAPINSSTIDSSKGESSDEQS